MVKAYDRIEWSFLENIVLKLGFDSIWVAIIMMCVKSVSYAVLINVSSTTIFVPTRGVREGDPMYPSLFLFCAEGLYALIKKKTSWQGS